MSKFYSIAFSLVLLSGTIIFSLGWYLLEPLSGDLTRVGGFSESNFGWNEPQTKLQISVKHAKETNRQNSYHDVLVLGDSFSHYSKALGTSWQGFFEHKTRLSIITYNSRNHDLEDLFKSDSFNLHPPRILVYEFVERSIYKLARRIGAAAECDLKRDIGRDNFSTAPALLTDYTSASAVKFQRDRGHPSFHDVGSFYRQKILGHNKVSMINLKRNDLFSNTYSGKILIFNKDWKKFRFDDQYYNKLSCYLLEMQTKFKAKGTTLVIMMVPDKSSAYAKYLSTVHPSRRNMFEVIEILGLNFLRLDIKLENAITQGAVDVYLPNDTHWGWRGSSIAATALAQWLEKRKLL